MINNWMKNFKESWETKNISAVLALFSRDVAYYETPFEKVPFDLLEKKWKYILLQENIELTYDVFVVSEAKSAIKWDLSYDLNGEHLVRSGTYLITLNKEGKCVYFHHTCENKN